MVYFIHKLFTIIKGASILLAESLIYMIAAAAFVVLSITVFYFAASAFFNRNKLDK